MEYSNGMTTVTGQNRNINKLPIKTQAYERTIE